MIKSIEEGRKEDGNRSIADKIIKRLHDLDKTSLENQGRWAWELLQNAKDSISDHPNRKVSVKLEIDNNNVIFSHNGLHFTEKDIRGLINQISSKEVEDNSDTRKTGRFGTGFLTTNLLSRVIRVKGIVKTDASELFKFEFPLNRKGKTTSQLAPQIENSWSEFQESTEQIFIVNENDHNTSFSYTLESIAQKNIAKIGLDEFIKLIPYVLTFNPTLELVEIIDNLSNRAITFTRDQNDNQLIAKILKTTNKSNKEILILYSSNEKVTIATELEKKGTTYSIKDIKNIPKLFCDFPLIGSENFHFPVIVNSFHFSPQTERDGVWLKTPNDIEVVENQQIIQNAVILYKNLIDKISPGNRFVDFYNIVNTKIPDVNNINIKWYKKNVQEPIRIHLMNAKIVELDNGSTEKESIKDMWFPISSYSPQMKNTVWKYTFDLFPNRVCKKEHIEYWISNSWNEWNKLKIGVVMATVSDQNNIENLGRLLKLKTNKVFDWINSFCSTILEDENNLLLFNKHKILPNQNGIFKKKSEIFTNKIDDLDLIEILSLIGKDWKDILVNNNITLDIFPTKTKKDIADEITSILKDSNNSSDESIKAISLLSEWFDRNCEYGKEFFPELFRKRAQLFMNTIPDKDSLYKVMRSKVNLAKLSKVAQTIEGNPELLNKITQAEELSNLLIEFGAQDISEIKKMLLAAQGLKATNPKTEITQEILLSLGITSNRELEEALQDKNLAAQFTHISSPNIKMFLHVQSLINRSKKNVIAHLKTLPAYDCEDIEELATTVIGGIKKNGILVNIVVRPSDNGEVIVYYSSEKDTLDFANSELWIDNGIDTPKHLTLGKILKKVGINKIPV